MRHIDAKTKLTIMRQIKALMDKEHIGNLTYGEIARRIKTKVSRETIKAYMCESGGDFLADRDKAIDSAIKAEIEKTRDVDFYPDRICENLPFEIVPGAMLKRAEQNLGYILKDRRKNAIITEIIMILNKYPECVRQEIPALLAAPERDCYQSPPTVRKHLVSIKNSEKWAKMLKNKNHPALKDQSRKSK